MTPLIFGVVKLILGRGLLVCMYEGNTLQHLQTPKLIAFAYLLTNLRHWCLRCVLFAWRILRKPSYLMVVFESVLCLFAIEDIAEFVAVLVDRAFVVVCPGT